MQEDARWSAATVESLRDLTPTVREFALRPATWSAFAPGSHIEVMPRGEATLVRAYSLVDASDGSWRIAVKRAQPGRGGSAAMWALQPGEALPVSAPRNRFALTPGAPEYLLLAGGIGVTPLVSMARALAARGERVRMIYAARTPAEWAYADELHALLGERLLLHADNFARVLDLPAQIAALAPGAQLYLCGPVGLMDAVRAAWHAAGRPAVDLRFETFGAAAGGPARPFRVRVPRHGVDVEVGADRTLLEALEAAGVPVLSDCRRGECGLCAMDVLTVDGAIEHRDVFLSAHDRRANARLCVCVSRATGCVTLDSAYRPDYAAAA